MTIVLVVTREHARAARLRHHAALFEHQAELAAIHPEAKNLSLATAVEGSPAPFHAGAIRYYTAQHAWPSMAGH